MASGGGMRIGQRSPLDCRNIKGVLDVDDPYSVPPTYLNLARNMYLPDPAIKAGVCARPGFQLMNPDAPLGDLAAGRIGQAIGVATLNDGSQVNVCFVGGKMYRVDPTFTVYDDITPTGGGAPAIDPGARVHMTPFSSRLCINDDLNPPWVADSLASTPATATVIVYTDAGAAWRAYGPARVYDGAVVWVVRYRPSISRTALIAWSEPDDPLSGYFQTGPPALDDEANVVENNADTVYAVFGTNASLDYWRDNSIGYYSGELSTFKTTPTRDAIDDAVGLRAPSTLQAFDTWIWFADREGRVHRIKQGGGIEKSWLQHRRVVTLAPSDFFDVNARASCSAIVPELDLYLVALWSPDPTQNLPQFPTTVYAFHAATGRYVGEWTIADGVAIHAMGVLVGADGRKVLAVLGTKRAPAAPQPLGVGGYLWILSSLADGIWTDDGLVPDIIVRTPALGNDPDIMLTVDEAVAIVQQLETDPTPVVIDIIVD